MGKRERSRFELFVQAPLWLLITLLVVVTLINLAWALRALGVF